MPCIVLNLDLRLVFEGTSDEVKAWLKQQKISEEYYVYLPDYDRIVTVKEYFETYV